jgi:hypothetical protein
MYTDINIKLAIAASHSSSQGGVSNSVQLQLQKLESDSPSPQLSLKPLPGRGTIWPSTKNIGLGTAQRSAGHQNGGSTITSYKMGNERKQTGVALCSSFKFRGLFVCFSWMRLRSARSKMALAAL